MIHINNRSDFSIVWKMPNGGILPTFPYTLEFSTRGGLRYAVKSDDATRFIPKPDADGQIRSAVIVFDFSNRPHLPSGRLSFTMKAAIPNTMYPDDYQDITEPHPTNAELWDGATDYKDAVEIELILPYVKGDKGDAGEGVPAGGRTGQVLKKKSDGDYDTTWGDDEGITDIAPGAVGTEEIADNAVTELKLAKGVRDNINGKLNKTETSTEPTASTVIRRDNNGRAKVATPEADDDIANKQYVDAQKIKEPEKAGNFVVLDANGMPIPSNYKPESFRKASDKIKTDDIAEKAVTESNLSDSIRDKLKAADGAVRYDAAQELTVEQMEQALLNLGLKFMVITNNDIGKVLSEERRAKLEHAEAVLFDTTNFHKVLLRGDDTSVHTKFVALVDSSRYYEATYNKSTYILSSISASRIIDSNAVRFNVPQSITTSQQEQVFANLGLKVVYINSSEFRTTLTEERANEILQADICIATYSGHQYAFYFSGRATTGLSYFTTLQSNENVLRFTVSDTFALSAIVIAKFVGGGSVRYDTTQNLTTSQQEQVSNNVGVPTVFFNESELGKILSEARAAQVESASILAVTSSLLGLRLFFRTLDESGRIWFTCTRSSSSIDSIYFYYESREITRSINSIYTDRGAVRYDNPQNITSSQQSRARKNIDGMKNTPSGDPMHYIYETAGAEWIPYADISTEGLEDWQVETFDRAQAQADGGVWWHNGIFVTVEQNRINYVYTIGEYPANTPNYQYYLCNIPITTNYKQLKSVSDPRSLNASIRRCENIVSAVLPNLDLNMLAHSFSYCPKLAKVTGIFTVSRLSAVNSSFLDATDLRDISLRGLNANIDLSGAPNLSMTSIRYAVTNAGTATLTITLAPAVYAAAMADADVQAALTSKPNVTLADAGASSSGAN